MLPHLWGMEGVMMGEEVEEEEEEVEVVEEEREINVVELKEKLNQSPK